MNNLIKNNPNRDFFRDLISPVLTNGFNHVFHDEDEVDVNFIPAANIVENEEGFKLSLALPGLNKKDISIEVKDELLVVKGAYHKEEENEGEKFHKKEIHSGNFSRSFRLGKNVKFDAVEAKFTDGLLLISIPKKEEEKVKKIAIK